MTIKNLNICIFKIKRCIVLLFVIFAFAIAYPEIALADGAKTDVPGKVFVFDKDEQYSFDNGATYKETGTDNTYGSFSVDGEIKLNGKKHGIPAYEISGGKLDFYYEYDDSLLSADLDSWHLVKDKTKKVADVKLDSNVLKGAIVVQISNDRKNWVEVETICNAFSDVPIRASSIYSATDVELINGCFYRVIVVYELSIRTEISKFLFINTDKYDSEKYAEVYEFFAYINSGVENSVDANQTYSLGEKVRVKNYDGYFGEELIKPEDYHYGWELGNFFVSGYTDEIVRNDGNTVFLKNVGDKVTLWFKLNQNIDGLNGNEKLSITADTAGYDQYFETPKMNFGRGVLIIRYTDYNNVKSEPVIYTNYLEANANVGADTKVQLLEEGDYEVALDYEVTYDGVIDKVGHYRIFFKFSVRNGNCMVYPFDVTTGNELTNSSMTENGFRLDLAKSRYLKINIKREVLKDSADGLAEDTRFNGAAKDGGEYTGEGIYTITVSNEYTGQLTTKKIYVGTNDILRAHVTTGLPITEINNLVADGAMIFEDGTIQSATIESIAQPLETEQPITHEIENESINDPSISDAPISVPKNNDNSVRDDLYIYESILAIIVVIVIGIVVFLIIKKKRRVKVSNCCDDTRGGVEE